MKKRKKSFFKNFFPTNKKKHLSFSPKNLCHPPTRLLSTKLKQSQFKTNLCLFWIKKNLLPSLANSSSSFVGFDVIQGIQSLPRRDDSLLLLGMVPL